MKTTIMTNLLLLASVTLFTACSNKTVKPQKVSIPIENLPIAKTYPMIESYTAPTMQYVQNIRPIYQAPIPVINYSNPYKYNYIDNRPKIKNHINPSTIKEPYRINNVKLTAKIEGDAKKLLGKKYVWGATGPRTYDCSGFTQKIYRDAGINIPRVSRDQAKVGQYVSFNNLKKGDLVFFDTHKKRTGKVTHVGIYLSDGNFIHASSGAKKIVIFNFNDKSFYKKRFLWARRVVKNNSYLAMK